MFELCQYVTETFRYILIKNTGSLYKFYVCVCACVIAISLELLSRCSGLLFFFGFGSCDLSQSTPRWFRRRLSTSCRSLSRTVGSVLLLLNILQDISFSNQRTFILHIQGVFNLPGRGFCQLITPTSSVPMTLNDVIVQMRQFVIALVSVDGCSGFPDPDGFLDMLDSSVGFLVYNFQFLPVYDWFSVVAWSVRADLLMVDINLFFLVYFPFFMLSTSFLCSSNRVLSSLPVSPMYSAPQFLHVIWYTSSPCSSSSTMSLGCTNRRLRVVWGCMVVATPYFFSTRCTLSETPSMYGMTTWLL